MSKGNKSSVKDAECAVVKVQRGVLDSIVVYDVTESELSALEAGSPIGCLFDVFVACGSISLSLCSTLFTVPNMSGRLYVTYLVFTICMGIGAVICFILWRVFRRRNSDVAKTIRARVGKPIIKDTEDPTTKEVES